MLEEFVMAPLPELGRALTEMDLAEPLVVALPPGGFAAAAWLSERLGAPFDVLLMHADDDSPVPPAAERTAWPLLGGRTVVLVDDGTDAAMRAMALDALRAMGAARLIVAVPAIRAATVPHRQPACPLTSRVRPDVCPTVSLPPAR